MIELFIRLFIGDQFHFGGFPKRILTKFDQSHYMSNSGQLGRISPYVAVIPEKNEIKPAKSIYDKTKGDSNER